MKAQIFRELSVVIKVHAFQLILKAQISTVLMHLFHKSPPILLPQEVFRAYHYLKLNEPGTKKNTGLLIEDGLFEFSFIKERDVSLVLSSGEKIKLPPCFMMGKPSARYKLSIPSTLTLFTLKLQPWVASFYYSVDGFKVLDLRNLFGEEIMDLHEIMFQQDDMEGIVKKVEDFFRLIALPSPEAYQPSKMICEEIYRSRGCVKVKDLMSLFPYSRQRINQLFLSQTKNSIKEFAIYCRIRAVIEYKLQYPGESLTHAAFEFGYFDQSHFIKDMKKATGLSPSNFLSQENLFAAQLNQGA